MLSATISQPHIFLSLHYSGHGLLLNAEPNTDKLVFHMFCHEFEVIGTGSLKYATSRDKFVSGREWVG